MYVPKQFGMEESGGDEEKREIRGYTIVDRYGSIMKMNALYEMNKQ